MSVTNKPKKRIKTAIGITLNAIAWVALIALFYFILFTGNTVHSTFVGTTCLISGFLLILSAIIAGANHLLFEKNNDEKSSKTSVSTIVNCSIALFLGIVVMLTASQYLSTTTCSACGRWKAATDSYCTDCGTKLPQSKHICPVCNEERETDFCGICGTKIVEVN